MTQEVYLPSPEATSPSEALPVCLPCPHSLSGPGAPEAIQGSRGPSPLDMPHAPQDRATEEREKGMGWCLPPRVAPHCAQREVLWAHAPPQSALCMELGSQEERGTCLALSLSPLPFLEARGSPSAAGSQAGGGGQRAGVFTGLRPLCRASQATWAGPRRGRGAGPRQRPGSGDKGKVLSGRSRVPAGLWNLAGGLSAEGRAPSI